jgi:hypothetical protein
MKQLFKLTFVLFITVQVSLAQEFSKIEMDEIHTIYKENFSADANTTLVLNLKNTAAQVFLSPDDNVYIEYTMEFKNYRKKIVESHLKRLIVSGKKEGDKITYTTKGKNAYYNRHYYLEDLLIGRYEKKDSIGSKKPKVVQKSLDSVLGEIINSENIWRNRLYGTLKIKPHVKKWKKSDKISISKMVIKIPENIHVRATLENSDLVFMDDFYNSATMNVRNSKLKFKTVGNPLNIFDIDNGYFRALEVNSGNYSFVNTKHAIIGRLKNSQINSEFTKLEIGEIGKGNKVIDFNSEYFFYNWAKDFTHFNLKSEYSKIHFFYPEANHSLEVVGFNTRNLLGDDAFEVNMQPNSRTKHRLMSKPASTNETSSGHIDFDIVNGIIYSHNDAIKSINN